MTKVLFIDYDNTLHDSDAKYAAKLDGTYGLRAEELIEAFMYVHRRVVHRQYPDKHDDFQFHQKLLSDHLKRPHDDEEAAATARKFAEAQQECWTDPLFFPDSLDFLMKAAATHTLCLTTGDYAREKADALQKAFGRNYFTHIFDNTHLGIKGGSEYFENALASTGAHPDEVVAIGDSLEHDVAAASAAGIETVWINRRGRPIPPEATAPDYEASDLFDVLDYLMSTWPGRSRCSPDAGTDQP